MTMDLFTIGFTKSSAEHFFTRLQEARVKRVIDVRLSNTSQLMGFSKIRDLPYFLKTIAEIEYVHLPQLAPTKEILDAYKKGVISWDTYKDRFEALLEDRKVEDEFDPKLFDGACLLCSEPTAEHCHRRLVAEHLASHWDDVTIIHLDLRWQGENPNNGGANG